VPVLEQLVEVPEEERQQERADVAPVDVGVGHDDDLDAHAVPAGLEANVPQAGLPSDPPRRPLEIEQTLPDPSAEPGQLPRDYMHDQPGIRSWLLTHDHKRIAIMFLVVVTLSLMLGGTFAMLLRTKLLTPGPGFIEPVTYNRLFTLHRVVMVFMFMIPAIPAVFGNFFLPMMLGAKDLAFPRINLASFYVYLLGAALTLWGMVHGGAAFAIASAKAVLVVSYFMHLSGGRPIHRIVFSIAMAFLVLLVIGILADVGTRSIASSYVDDLGAPP
jgi:caa(3)-type oxidase subunit IV